MAISSVAVGQTATAAQMNAVIGGVNGQALTGVVPTSVVNGTFSANGLVTFTNAASISVNGVFSGTYANYRVAFNSSTRSAAATLFFRWRNGGSTEITSATYAYVRSYDNGTARNILTGTAATNAPLDITTAAGVNYDGFFDVSGPLSGTLAILQASATTWTGSTIYAWQTNMVSTTTSTPDGFSVYPGSGTFTGTVRVYGYNNLT